MKKFRLMETNTGNGAIIEYYKPSQKTSDISVVIFPGGGYTHLASHEGIGYARFLNTLGFTAFVVNYSVAPSHFPSQLIEARRAIRFVRLNAEKFGLNKNKILAMGSSAGGQLTALLCTYLNDIGEEKDELFKEDFLPNGQILCYPVISSDESICHKRSFQNLLGELYQEKQNYSPELLVNPTTPPAFIWHTGEDATVSCLNSCRYAESLWKNKVNSELHIFPFGEHGKGLALDSPHVAQWTTLLNNWIKKYF